jgi:hypothetical protein
MFEILPAAGVRAVVAVEPRITSIAWAEGAMVNSAAGIERASREWVPNNCFFMGKIEII